MQQIEKLTKKILIVDDVPLQLALLETSLKQTIGFETKTCTTGKEALETLPDWTPDVILLDIMMPDMDGFETLEHIKANDHFRHIPIIFLTAVDSKEEIIKAFQAGAVDYIKKPYNMYETLARINTHYELAVRKNTTEEDLRRLLDERTIELENEVAKRLKLETQLRHSQKLEALGQLASGIAHDFNNQLGGIRGNAALINMYNNDDRVKECSESITKAVDSAASLTSQLLSFARKGTQVTTVIEINECIESSISIAQRSLEQNINIDFIPSDNFKTKGDPGQLQNVFLNMLINASHAMPDGGTLTIETKETIIRKGKAEDLGLTQGKFITISFKDTGTGISKDNLEKVFNPFFTTKSEGTGMGLSASYGIVRSHKGVIDVKSKEGLGTTFTIFLPFEEAITNLPDRHTAKLLREKKFNIIMADDNDINRIVTKQILIELGHNVMEAFVNGEEAFNYFVEHQDQVDLIVLDRKMPIMGGIEAFRQMRLIKPELKGILITGYMVEEDSEVYDAGFTFLVKKPYTLAKLSEALTEVHIS